MAILMKPSRYVSSPNLPPLPNCRPPPVLLRFQIGGRFHSFPCNRSITRRNSAQVASTSVHEMHSCKSNRKSLFCYDKSIPAEVIEKPVGLDLEARDIGSNPPCAYCQAKGATLCVTCSGSGLYVESILESQGIIVKVRCLGCGGVGNIMCSRCGGRGHN